MAQSAVAAMTPAIPPYSAEPAPSRGLGFYPAYPDLDIPSEDSEADLPPELPAYTRRVANSSSLASGSRSSPGPETVYHRYYMTSHKPKDHRWLTFKIRSWARSSKSLPYFNEGQPLAGQVKLDLEKPEGIQAVIVTVKGEVVYSGIDSALFYESGQTLWDTSMGDPRSPTPGGGKHDGKLNGQYTWRFSTVLPKEVHLSAKRAKELGLPQIQTLPPSFSEKGSSSLIHYEIAVIVKRTGTFRLDSKLDTLFRYTPRSQPQPASALRQMAYQENIPLLSPELDPLGWKIFPPVDMNGTLFHVMKVSVHCTLALALPLSYTRGSVIPCILTLESTDAQALDLLSNPNNPIVHLRRKLNSRVGMDNVGTTIPDGTRDSHLPLSKACWWPPEERSDVPEGEVKATLHKRTLIGEIKVPSEVKPSFTFGKFTLKYFVEIHPFEAAGFVPATESRLFRTEVEVATEYARGPRPRAYLPPCYDESGARSTKGVRRLQLGGFM